MPPHRPAIERFKEKLSVDKQSGCWLWEGSVSRNYGYIRGDEGKNLIAHRFAYTHFKGPVPDGMFIIHDCHNPRCVNPDHLRAGDHAENMRDLVKSGRALGAPKGTRMPSHDLARLVQLIRQGKTQQQVANILGVHRTTVQRAIYESRSCASAKRRYLTDDDHKEIVRLLENGWTVSSLAKDFNVDRKTIRNARDKLKGT